ncbi:MAG: hypothetical protein H7308_14600 [Chthonomonadaceae bacterium]|nr:hypothetical protein [Chthonomonadaceae bacterium]
MPLEINSLLDDMKQKEDLVVETVIYHTQYQNRPAARRKANLHVFDVEEVSLIHLCLEEFREMNATEISNFSHRFAGWKQSVTTRLSPTPLLCSMTGSQHRMKSNGREPLTQRTWKHWSPGE